MPKVISLCDSDSDDDGGPSSSSIRQPTKTTTSTTLTRTGTKKTSLDNFVDLLDDSSDEEDAAASSTSISPKVEPRYSSRQTIYGKPSSERKDSAITVPGKKTSSADIHLTSSKRRRSHDKAKKNAPFSVAAAHPRYDNDNDNDSDSDSDSDSDDSILNYKGGLTLKKTTTTTTATASTCCPKPTLAKKVSPDSSPAGANFELSTSPHHQNGYSKMKPSTDDSSPLSSPPPSAALGAPANVTISNPYAKAKRYPESQSVNPTQPASSTSPSTNISRDGLPIQYPNLLPRSKSYPDVRPKLILSLWKRARTLVDFAHDGRKLDNTVKKIVTLAVSEYPIRSLDEYLARYFGVGGVNTTSGRIQRSEFMSDLVDTTTTTPVDACRDGRYYSIVEACLVAVSEEMECKLRNQNISPSLEDNHLPILATQLAEKDMWISLESLIPQIDRRLKPECPGKLMRPKDLDNGAAHYMEPSTRSAEYLQLKNLLKTRRDVNGDGMSFLKQHARSGQTFFEMTILGYQTATRIRSRQFPAPPSHYRCSNLGSVQPRFENICLGVDIREGGGPASVLHIMCNKLDTLKIPYCVGTLSIGDYVFFSGNKLCPILVERKSIQDVAQSIHDGRWKKQKQRMYHGQYVFGYGNCRIAFVIEGKAETQQVTGGYIGHRMFNVDRQRLDDEIENLESEGFEVLRTMSPENSMVELSRWAMRVAEEVRNGKLAIKYTYEEFEREVKKISSTTDFSRLAKDAMETRKAEAEAKMSVDRNSGISSDSDIEVLDSVSSKVVGFGKENGQDQKIPTKKPRTGCSPPKGPAGKISSIFLGAAGQSKKAAVDYSKWSLSELQKKCVEYGLTKSGTKASLVERLNGPHPPKVWLQRKQQKKFVPARHDSCATAILVGLYLHERDNGGGDNGNDYVGMTKEELYTQAETLDISKDPFSGGVGNGPYNYDGWSSMAKLIQGDDPPLVTKKKGRFKLTRSCSIAGYPLAEALHAWCHDYNNCKCGDL